MDVLVFLSSIVLDFFRTLELLVEKWGVGVCLAYDDSSVFNILLGFNLDLTLRELTFKVIF